MKKNRNKIFIIFLSYGIMLISELVKGNSLTLREFDFDSKPIKAYTDAIKYHVKANGYEKKYKDEMENNFYKYTTGPGRELESERAKMQGYGNYVMKPDTSLYGFIEYCHIADSVRCDIASRYLDETNINYCNYEKLMTYKNQVLSGMKTTHVNNFWTLMSSEEFNRYQDIYYYCYYTHKVVLRSGFSLSYLSEIRDRDKDGSKEFLTVSTTYAYAIGKDSAINFTVERGDIIPFLYVKYRGTEENDSYVDDEEFERIKSSPYEIARYVYVALIEGWVENIDDNHLWEEEYEAVFGETYRSDDLIASVDTLREWYTVAKEKYKRERGNKGNNLIGSNLDTIIESDYSISEQIEAVDYYLKNVVEIGKYKENMARNELMAKYMMENSRINDIIKDYSVGINFITENLQRGTSRSKNTKSIVLSDFQVLEFDHTLNEKNKHSDEDGITDLEELTGKANGDIEKDRVKWVEITSPLKKAYISKKGSEVGYAEELKRLFTNNGGKFDKNGNKIQIGHFDYDENNRAYYRTTNYVSNPMLNDTDFDGIQDNEDSNKTRGEFKGSAGDIGKIEYTNAFRNSFVDNYKYNDELSVMSLMIANGKYVDTNQVNVNSIKQYIERLGFKNVLLKENFRIFSEKAKSKALSEILKAQMNIDVAKEELSKRKEAHDKASLEEYIKDVTEYASACAELSILAAEEAKLAALETVAAEKEYDEKYGNEE